MITYRCGGSARSPFVKDAAYLALATSASLETDMLYTCFE